MTYVSKGSKTWQAIQDKEYIKLLIADMRRIRADIEVHTLNYSPLNPDESLDAIYQLAKQMERDLDTLYKAYLDDWTNAVIEARGGEEFEGEEAADIEAMRNIIKTKEMGKTTRKRTNTGHLMERWKRTTR